MNPNRTMLGAIFLVLCGLQSVILMIRIIIVVLRELKILINRGLSCSVKYANKKVKFQFFFSFFLILFFLFFFKDAGSCLKCYKNLCEEAFHIECARRSNICLEIKTSEKCQYLLYCELHTPL